MKPSPISVVMLVVSLFLAPALLAQTPAAANQSAASPAPSAAAAEVPRLIKFSGTLLDALDQPLAGPVGVTFALYKEQEKGAALWMETQNVTPDAHGLYTVFLGANSAHGVPAELFASGEARWLEVQVERQAEQPRVLLVSVPYALKAADADTLGGKPASVFLTAEQVGASSPSGKRSTSAGVALPAVGGTGSTNVVAKWLDNAGTLGNSQMTDDGTNVNMTGNAGALAYKFTGNAPPPTDPTATIFNQAFVGPVFSGLSFKVRTGLLAPGDALSIDTNRNVSMTGNASALTYKFTGNAALPTDATATILNAANVGPVFSGFSFRVRTGSPPADALSVDPSQNVILSGNLNLSGAGKAIIFPNGTVMSSAATGVGGGTITGVAAGTGLSGGGTTGGVSLGINPAVVPQLGAGSNTFTGSLAASSFAGSGAGLTNVNAALLGGMLPGAFATTGANTFTGSQSITGNLALPTTASSSVGVVTLGGASFLHNFGISNTFLGSSAGNTTMVGSGLNTAVGASALNANTNGNSNAAFGAFALQNNTQGGSNSAFGNSALQKNTQGGSNSAFGDSALVSNTGSANSAFGRAALDFNTTGFGNSAFGFEALVSNTTGNNNSAFGYNALNTLASGNSNIAIGFNAGSKLTAAETNDIYIGHAGVAGESNTIRIGDPAVQTATFLAGNVSASGSMTATSFIGSGASTFTGQNVFAAVPTGAGVNQGSVYINPASANAGQTLLGAAVGGAQKMLLDSGGNLTLSGSLALPNTTSGGTAGIITLGGAVFAHNFGTDNTFLGGSAGNFMMTGIRNTASGALALQFNAQGSFNTASGFGALNMNAGGNFNTANGENSLLFNTSGNSNTASGEAALYRNTTGSNNTAVGVFAGLTANSANANTTGSNNTFIGFNSGPGVPSASSLSNATAMGANALVSCNNCMVLGDSTMPMNVGIGTVNPSSALHVVGSQPASSASSGSAATQVLQVTGGKGGNTTGSGVFAGTGAAINLTAGAGGDAPAGSAAGAGGSVTIQGGAAGVGAGFPVAPGNVILAPNGGSVVIGTGNAFGLLDVRGFQPPPQPASGTSAQEVLTLIGGQGGDTTGTGTKGGAGADVFIQAGSGGNSPTGSTDGNGGSVFIEGGNGGTIFGVGRGSPGVDGNVVLARHIGSVGIGLDSPATKFQVFGDIRVGTGSPGPNGCLQDSSGSAIIGTCSSDARLKTSIRTFLPVLDKLVHLQPVYFHWNAEMYPEFHFGSDESFGLIAQEAEKVLPELVTEDEKGFKAVKYHALPLLLLQAIRELKAENDSLRERLKSAQKRNKASEAQLEERLARLEALLAPQR